MGPDPHPDSPEDGARHAQDSGRADENQAGTSAQFAAGRRFDTEKAGLPLAAALAGVQAELGSLDDDALAGFLGGCQKIAAWAAGMLLDGIAEFAGRRPDDGTPGRAGLHAAAVKKAQTALAAGEPADPPGCDEFTADELMPVLRLSKGGALRQVALALALRYRLRATLAALLDGRIDMIRARIIAEATDDLSPAGAAAVEALVLPRAWKQTYVALGQSVGKAVVQVDPAGAMKRRKRGEKQARVERWREYDGTGALAGRNLPPDDTAEDGDGPEAGDDDADGVGEGGGAGGTKPPPRPGGPPPPGGKREQRKKRRGKRIQARINLTIPVKTLLELGGVPGEAGPFGPLDPAAAREMARAAAAHPGTRWCLTVTDSQGRAVAHGCARGPRPWAGPQPRAGPEARDAPLRSDPNPHALIRQFLAQLGITLEPIATDCCDHHDAEPGYTPSRRLRHKIHARSPACSYWGCRRPAAQCDDDHTDPWHAGGLTCQCNLAPLCRRHHRMKQRQGWRLEQPAPGVLRWRTPGGRSYTTTPATYVS